MDNSPAYENFMNKMSTMNSGPKINVTSMKIGGLEGRVANNERKITAIKNIFKAQKIDIGKKISPNNSPVEILTQTNETLIEIKNQLEMDFVNSKKTEEDRLSLEKQLLLKEKREKRETEIETVKKNNKFVNDAKKRIVSPFVDIFERLKRLAFILGTGLFVNNLVSLMSKPEFVDGLKRIFDWTTKNWKLIAGIGGTLIALNILGSAKTLFTIAKILFGIVSSKAFIAAALFLGPALYKGVPKEIKLAITELEMMGGITPENRELLKQKLLEERSQLNMFQTGRKEAIDGIIQFLDYGIIKNVKFQGSRVLDFEKLASGLSIADSIIEGPAFNGLENLPANKQFHDGGYNPSGIGAVHGGEFVFDRLSVNRLGLDRLYALKEGDARINIEQLTPIDLRKKKVVKKMSGNPATYVEHIDPINSSNPYMNEVPMLFGFNDLVYT